MWWTGCEGAQAAGFVGFKSVAELRATRLSDVPRTPGVYLIIHSTPRARKFMAMSTGGHFKGKNPTVDIMKLDKKWVPNAQIIYIGQAGGVKQENRKENKSTLRSRLDLYLKFGSGKPVGHAGGSYIWQIENSDSLLVCWKITQSARAIQEEQELIDEFVRIYGCFPFANRRR